jgi:hypothetical protein
MCYHRDIACFAIQSAKVNQIGKGKKVKISLFHAVEAHRVARG